MQLADRKAETAAATPTEPARRSSCSPFERILGPLAAVCSLLLSLRTLAPSLGGTIDSPEFQQATYSLSIVHPTGYPLYLVLGRLWIAVFPFGDPAYRVNLMSAIFGALAVWVLYETVRYLTGGNLLAALGAAALGAVQAIPWAISSVAEINTFNSLLTGLAFLCAVLWATGRIPLPLAAFALGLALSHHRTAALYVPFLLLSGLAALKWGSPKRPNWRTALLSILLLILPFAAYIYLPLRGNTTDWYSNSLAGFWLEVLGESALPVIQGALSRPLVPRFRALLLGQVFTGWTGWALAGLGLLGLVYVIWRLRKRSSSQEKFRAGSFILYAASFALGISFATLYDILDVTDYLGVPIFMWCVLAGAGIALLADVIPIAVSRLWLPQVSATAAWAALLLALCVLTGFTAFRSLHRTDLQVDFSGLNRWTFWDSVKAQDHRMRTGGVVIADWPEANEALYLQHVQGWRPDLHFVKLDDIRPNDFNQVDNWLAQKQPVYLLGEHIDILSNFNSLRKGEVWLLTDRKPKPETPPMQHTLNRRYGSSIVLLGYTLDPEPPTLAPGGLLNVTLYWKTDVQVNERYVVFNHIVDEQGGKIGQKDDEPGRGFNPTVYWEPGQVVADTFPIAIDPKASPGTYRLVTGMYERITERRLPATSQDGKSLGDYPEVTTITVK